VTQTAADRRETNQGSGGITDTAMRSWTDEHFDTLSWHDNHVHGLRVVAGEHGTGKLVLDLDHILEWRKASENKFQFLIAPAVLIFHDVSDLKVELDYRAASAALTPFSIHGITRTLERRERYTATLWRIEVNWPQGEITFEASGFEQRTTAEPTLSDDMWLGGERRDA
jgi:hypothetical protein